MLPTKNEILMEQIKEDISEIKRDCELISKALFVGNGKPSLLARVAVLEEKASSLKEHHITKSTRKWGMLVAVVGGAFGIFGGVLSLLF